MKKNITYFYQALAALFICISLPLHAITQPKFTLTPTTPTSVQLGSQSIVNMQYQVTNQTKNTRTLTYTPIPGITQITNGPGLCANPFTLATHQSCLLSLQVNGSQVSTSSNGPVVCKISDTGANTPDPFLCSQPSLANSVNINVVRPYAYVTDTSNNTLMRCSFNESTGNLTQCINAGVSGLSAPRALAINSARTFVYMVNSNNLTTVIQCQLDQNTGNLSACEDSGATGLGPNTGNPNLIGIALNAENTFAYVSNITNSVVYSCSINASTGHLGNCINSGATGLSAPEGITLNLTGNMAYIANNITNNVTQCSVNSNTGGLSNCMDSGATGIASPRVVAFNAVGNKAYITNVNLNTISVCNVNLTTGNLSNCVDSGGTGFNAPEQITLNAEGTFAYVANYSANTISQCSVIPSSGLLNNCINSGATVLTGSWGVVFN